MGFVVDDIEEVERRLLSNGYEQNPMETEHPYRKRLYFYDSDGLEWEFIQYLTHDSKKRNDYEH
ncbi:VOC family protein [Vibrio sp. vnigr-6D03]|uniref:VOC family protein n=1 Tax=Vibrio sp. vnigr-6D03 TaxID=2058088 RepID=UPI0031BA9C63